jgi:hypothetical protein
MIDINVLDFSLDIIQKAVYFQVQRIDIIPEMLDAFIDEHIEYINDKVDLFYDAKEVYWIYGSFKKEDFHKQVSDSFGKKLIRTNSVINIKFLDEKQTKIVFVHYELDSLSSIRNKRKTIHELKLNLEEAIEQENYELAQKIKNKIELKEKITKTNLLNK